MIILKENLNPFFIKKSIKKFGRNKLDYSLINYVDQYTKITIVCKQHNIKFKQTPKAHLKSKNGGCPYCFSESISKLLLKNSNTFFKEAKEMHADTVDYSKCIFINNTAKSIFICKIHNNEYSQKPKDHIRGNGGCPICSKEKIGNANKKTHDEFIQESKLLFKDKFDYSKTNYTGALNKITISCKKHGEFNIIASEHLSGCGGCTKCKSSIGEMHVFSALEKYKKFGDLIVKKRQRI